jgi:ATP/maltotriose-dependent transcriptional regulator MalT
LQNNNNRSLNRLTLQFAERVNRAIRPSRVTRRRLEDATSEQTRLTQQSDDLANQLVNIDREIELLENQLNSITGTFMTILDENGAEVSLHTLYPDLLRNDEQQRGGKTRKRSRHSFIPVTF